MRRRAIAASLVLAAACSRHVELDGAYWTCELDADCGPGFRCDAFDDTCVDEAELVRPLFTCETTERPPKRAWAWHTDLPASEVATRAAELDGRLIAMDIEADSEPGDLRFSAVYAAELLPEAERLSWSFEPNVDDSEVVTFIEADDPERIIDWERYPAQSRYALLLEGARSEFRVQHRVSNADQEDFDRSADEGGRLVDIDGSASGLQLISNTRDDERADRRALLHKTIAELEEHARKNELAIIDVAHFENMFSAIFGPCSGERRALIWDAEPDQLRDYATRANLRIERVEGYFLNSAHVYVAVLADN